MTHAVASLLVSHLIHEAAYHQKSFPIGRQFLLAKAELIPRFFLLFLYFLYTLMLIAAERVIKETSLRENLFLLSDDWREHTKTTYMKKLLKKYLEHMGC